jgi:hypothetical protein
LTLTYVAIRLPAGLAMDATTGIIAGTPVDDGSFDVAVTVTDAASIWAAYTLVIAEALPVVASPEPLPLLVPYRDCGGPERKLQSVQPSERQL